MCHQPVFPGKVIKIPVLKRLSLAMAKIEELHVKLDLMDLPNIDIAELRLHVTTLKLKNSKMQTAVCLLLTRYWILLFNLSSYNKYRQWYHIWGNNTSFSPIIRFQCKDFTKIPPKKTVRNSNLSFSWNQTYFWKLMIHFWITFILSIFFGYYFECGMGIAFIWDTSDHLFRYTGESHFKYPH